MVSTTAPDLRAILPKHPFVSVGCDPEFFIRANSKHVSAIDLFPGNKKNPVVLNDYIKKDKELGTVIHDNVAVEFTMPPATSKEKFAESITEIRMTLMDILRDKFPRGTSIELDYAGSAVFPDHLLAHPEAIQFGCDPDFDAWDGGKEKLPPNVLEVGNLRAVGGHIHVGFLKGASEKVEALLKDDYGKIAFIQLMDMSVGQLVAHQERQLKSKLARFARRRTMYGAAGSYRPKPYGVEYRSPSPIWCSSKMYAEDVYNTIQILCGIIDRSKDPYKLPYDLLDRFDLEEDAVIRSVNMSKPIIKLLNFFRTYQVE